MAKMYCAVVCCSVLQCVAFCCILLQCVTRIHSNNYCKKLHKNCDGTSQKLMWKSLCAHCNNVDWFICGKIAIGLCKKWCGFVCCLSAMCGLNYLWTYGISCMNILLVKCSISLHGYIISISSVNTLHLVYSLCVHCLGIYTTSLYGYIISISCMNTIHLIYHLWMHYFGIYSIS